MSVQKVHTGSFANLKIFEIRNLRNFLIPIPCLIPYNTYMLQTGIGIAGGDCDFRILEHFFSKQEKFALILRLPG